MKKVFYVLGALSVSLFFSCEPESIVEENEINQGEVYTIDKRNLHPPKQG